MNITNSTSHERRAPVRLSTIAAAILTTALTGVVAEGRGQGTMTFAFEGAPRGTEQDVGTYYESGMRFAVLPPGRVLLCGGGISGYPDNGTGYLEVPDAAPGVGGLTFAFTQTLPSVYFNLLSFDAAEYDGAGPVTMEVVGYKGMAGTVTSYFSVNSQTFQTFHLDSTFSGVFQINVLNARFSLDNVVVSGVPEPASGTLIIVGALCAIARSKVRRERQ
jgi:hypothetical protein